MFGKILICAVVAAFPPVNIATAQQQPPAATQQSATIKPTPLQKFDVPGTNHEMAIAMAEIVPAIHDAKSGPNGTKVVAAYVVEKGKPLASPAA